MFSGNRAPGNGSTLSGQGVAGLAAQASTV